VDDRGKPILNQLVTWVSVLCLCLARILQLNIVPLNMDNPPWTQKLPL
jgi:hypothetical protein